MMDVKDLQVELDAEAGVVRAIDQLSLTLRRGETFALVGESGCGKSMTALALMRLLPENARIPSGHIVLDDARLSSRQELLDLPERLMRQVRGGRIGMIFQEPSTSLNPVMRVGDQIVEAIETHTSLRGAQARERAVQWLHRVGIPEPERRFHDHPFRMSGGQKQRVMIAMTLAAEPDFIVADEPTTALDVTIQAQVLDLLKSLQRERQLGLLLITHDLAVVSQMAHRVALMYAGQIVEVASAADFFRSPSHPYAQALLKALPQASQRDKVLESIPGSVPPLWLQFEGCRFESRCKHANADCRQVPPALKPLSPGHEVRCLRAPLAPSAAAPHIAASADPVMARHQAPQSSMGPIADSADPVMARREAPRPSVPPSQFLLQVQDLRVTYTLPAPTPWAPKRHFHAVDGISFSIAPGQTLALVGESGCGKTTTGKAIAQLLRRLAQLQGRITLHPSASSPQAQPVDLLTAQGPDLLQVRRAIQIIFQDPFASLNPRMRVADILEEGVKSLVPDLDPQARRQRIRGLVDRVGLRLDALERYPHEFSGGQRQRIAIARALAVSPQLVICDEPTSALDVSVQAQILNLLRDLQSDMGLSYLFITHNIAVVEVLAHQVAVMRAGVIVDQGPAHAVLSSPQETYTRDLLAAVPRLRTEVPTDPVL